ncbi:MAG TPA: VUT family protein [Trueperaceae bacterium]
MTALRTPSAGIVFFALIALLTQAGCSLLLYLSSFGQDPFTRLPLPVIVMFGALAAAPLHSLARRLPPPDLLTALALALTLNAALLLLPVLPGETRYLAAPATALLLGLLFRNLPRHAGAMLAAMSVYVVATVLANYTFDSFLPIGGFFLINVGTLFFGVTFTQRDRVHRFGRRWVYLMILMAAVANVLMSLHLGTPMRYVVVGFLAILLSESADTEIYARLLDRPWFTRVASSNAVSAPLDTTIFTVLAFAGAEFATIGWMLRVIVTDVLVKYGSGLLAALQLDAWAPALVKPELPPRTRT